MTITIKQAKASGFFTFLTYLKVKFKKPPLTFRRTQFWTHSRGRTRQTGRPTITKHHQHLIVNHYYNYSRNECKSHRYLYSKKQAIQVFCGHGIGSDRAEGHSLKLTTLACKQALCERSVNPAAKRVGSRAWIRERTEWHALPPHQTALGSSCSP